MSNKIFHTFITVLFCLASLFNGISTFVGYLMPKTILLEEQ